MSENISNILGKGVFSLPCGYVDPSGNIHKEIHLHGMDGGIDEVLDDSELSVSDRITNVLVECIEMLGTVTDKNVIKAALSDTLLDIGNMGLPLTAQDRIAALLYLRRVTLGDIYKFEKRCPRCGEVNKNKQLDLKAIEITPVRDPKKRKVKVTLPKSKKTAVLKVLAAKDEKAVGELKPTQKDLKICAILARLESLDDTSMPTNPASAEVIKKLPQGDLLYLIQVYTLMEGNVDTNIQMTCKNGLCGAEVEFPMDLGGMFYSNQITKPTEADLQWI